MTRFIVSNFLKVTGLRFLFLLLPVSILADSPRTLAEVLALTVMYNPQINTYEYDHRAADARILQAGFRPNPDFDVEVENLNAPIFMQTTFLLSQLIEIGGKRQARLGVARGERDKFLLDYEVLKRQIFVETTLLFIDVLFNQKKVAFLKENLERVQSYSPVVEKRVKAGKASPIEESNYQILLHTARVDLQSAQNDWNKARSRLAAQWGDPSNYDFRLEGNLEWIPRVISLSELGDTLEQHPQITRAYFEENLRGARNALERSKAYPDVNLRGGPRYLEEAKKWVWVVGANVPLPVFDRNQGRIWESRENLDRLEKERESLWISLLTELNLTYTTLETLFSEIELYKNVIQPAAESAYKFSKQGYEMARYNYLELIETERTYRTTQLRYLEALNQYHKALAVLQGLTGAKAIIYPSCESQ